MITYRFDGEIHALDDQFAYILLKIDELVDVNQCKLVEILMAQFIDTYNKYLKRLGVELVKNTYSINNLEIIGDNEKYKFIYRPGWTTPLFIQPATLALKFLREPNDGLILDEENE